MSRFAIILLAFCQILFAGCGTFGDALAGPIDNHLYYRGVRLDVAGIKNGLPIMALDLPLSAVADTLMVPSIAYHQLTDPPGTQHKAVIHVVGEELGKSIANDVIVPIAAEMSKIDDDQQQLARPPAAPVEFPTATIGRPH